MATKTHKWFSRTITAAALFFMMSGGIAMLFTSINIAGIVHLGYPAYLCRILGAAKILGGLAILQDRNRTLKEWAYAGYTFELLGAVLSHAIVGDPLWKIVTGPMMVLLLVLGSYVSWKKRRQHPTLWD